MRLLNCLSLSMMLFCFGSYKTIGSERPIDPEKSKATYIEWNSVPLWDNETVAAIASTNFTGKGIETWIILGKIVSGERDPWLWPFSKESIWNMPIGSHAIYVDANFEAANHVGVDIQHILELSVQYPDREVLGTEVWGPGRCNGKSPIGIALRVPDNWIVPDAGSSPYGLTPNSNFALRLPDSDIVFEGCQITRCVEAGPVYLPLWMKIEKNRKYQSLTGDGLSGGGQGASGMSALGGTIRLGEFVNENPIRHAIKINPWAKKYCYYHDTLPGFKWPAVGADSYAKEQYSGTNRHILMGSLLAIPPHLTADAVGLETIPGRKLFFAMQNYGVYFTEDAAWDTWDLIVERDVELEFKETFGFSMSSVIWNNEVNKLMKALSVVVNNMPDQIGGGGAPLQPYAPKFRDNRSTQFRDNRSSQTKE